MYVRELRQDQEHGRTATRPRPAPSDGPRKGGRPLSAETDKLIADMISAGRPYSEIAPKARVPVGAITKIRKRLDV